MAREESQGVETFAAGFEMGATCLLVACLGALEDGRDALQVGGARFLSKRERSDQCVGGVADLAHRDLRVFPPATARSGGPGTND